MGRLLARLFRSSVNLHFAIPLFVALIVGSSFAVWIDNVRTWGALWEFWRHQPLIELVSIYVTYVVVLVLSVRRATEIRMANIGALRDVLSEATAYRAVSATSLDEWFDPANQLYFITIGVKRAREPSTFWHERVLLFFSRDQLSAVHGSFLDEHYAKCFAAAHERCGIPIGYLRPDEVTMLLRNTSVEDLRAMKCVPWWLAILPDAPLLWTTSRLSVWRRSSLAFAVVEIPGGSLVLRFVSHGGVLDIERIGDAEQTSPYMRLLEQIQKTIYRTGSTALTIEHDFVEHLGM